MREAVDLAFGDEWIPTGARSASGLVTWHADGATPPVDGRGDGGQHRLRRPARAGALPAATTFPVELVVDRCDTHALIESKRTFKFPLDVTPRRRRARRLVVLEAVPGTPARDVFADLIQACIG